ncbi:MAG: integrase [Cellvibrionaceae bacterium]|nr:integrase [Cellvibrionaceae bacterium]|tara:strand:+ start:8638 stop:10551 length:1914 start_codon:yes stop_codon:yes gene_type:complete
MHNVSRWVAGFAVRFQSYDMNGIWLIRRVNGSNVTLANIDNQKVVIKTEEELSKNIEDNDVQFLAEDRYNGEIVFQDLSESDQIETVRKYAYTKAYLESDDKKRSKKKLDKLIQSVARTIGDNLPPAWNTLNNWINQYCNAGERIKGLYPNHYKKGCRSQRLDSRVYTLIADLVPLYNKDSQMLISSVYAILDAKILKHNLDNPQDLLKLPVYSTFAYHMKRRTYQEHILGRFGPKRARYEFSKVGEAPETSRILERVEADHTPLDINVLNDDTETLLGRPTLTVLIDHYSRMVMGFQISFEEPSYASASLAVGSAVLPKNELLDSYGVEGSWPAHGVMETMVADNGTEFWGDNLDMAISEVGSVLQYSPVKSPNYKGVVERFFRTLKTMLIDALPGKTNGVGNGSDEYKAEQEAKLTLTQFKKIFLNWLVNIYHLEPRGKAENSPLELWNESSREFPVVEEDRKRIETILMASDTRTIQRDGVQIENLKYNSDSLRDIYRREGVTKTLIKYSPFDIGHIYVFDELNGIYVCVRCDNYRYAKGLSMYAHKAIQKHANEQRKSYKDNAVLQRAKVEIFGNIEELHRKNSRRKTQVTAKKAARVQGLGVADITVQTEELETVIVQNSLVEETTDDWEVW